jgi:hypothetical protein
MPTVRTFSGFRPSPRADDVPWNRIRIGEGAEGGTIEGPFTILETQALSPLDDHPEDPVRRDFTTELAELTEGWYELVFLDAGDNLDEPIYVHWPVAYGYPTTAELLSQSNVPELLALDEEAQESLRLAAIVSIETWTGQSFTFSQAETVDVESAGGYELYLPRRLVTLTSIAPFGADAMELSAVTVSAQKDKLVFHSRGAGMNYYEQALYEMSGGDYPIGFPAATLQITGDWGWETAPDAIQTALRFDMEEQALADSNALSPTVNAVRRLGLSDIGQGSLRATLVTPPLVSPRVERLLHDYIWMGQGGRLV